MKHILFYCLILIACTSKNESTAQNQASDLVHRRVSLEEFKSIIAQEGVQLVDIRTSGEYNAGYIESAVNIDFLQSDFVENCTTQLDKEKPLAIYCASGGRSSKALQQLKQAGFKQVYELGVGYTGYK